MSKVAYIKFKKRTKQELYKSVAKAMRLCNWKRHIKGKKIFLKINSLSDQVVPGQCTSPWFVEAVIQEINKGLKCHIFVGDADVCTAKQSEKSALLWGIKEICASYKNVTYVPLSKQRTGRINAKQKIKDSSFDFIDIPRVILEADSIVTLPVLKTHNVTGMTFSMKNQWGCLPRMRHQFHLVAHKCIPEINKLLGVDFAIGDATVCLEENGPRVGRPKVMDSVFASADLVAIDSAGCHLMKMNPNKVGQIKYAAKHGLGKIDYKLIGDKMKPKKFKPSLVKNHPIVKIELFLRKIPVINYLIFKTFLFNIPAWIAAKYNSLWWYNLKGKSFARYLIKKDKLYREEFEHLIK